MLLFPAIDLIFGDVVRLREGRRDRVNVYSHDPVAVAQDFVAQGSSWVHVVDLSRAFGEDKQACQANRAALKAICQVPGLCVDTGGGVRSLKDIEELLGLGVERVSIGTALIADPKFAQEAAKQYPDALVADVAAKDGLVRVNAWRTQERLNVDEVVKRLVSLGFCHLVFTDIARDGMQTGIDTSVMKHIAELAGFPIVASGGIATLEDIRALAALGPQVIEAAIVGRALYEKNFTLKEALEAAQGGKSDAV